MLLAYLLPGLSLAFNRRPYLGVLLLLLQPTLIAWIVGAPLAARTLKRQRRRRRTNAPGLKQPSRTHASGRAQQSPAVLLDH